MTDPTPKTTPDKVAGSRRSSDRIFRRSRAARARRANSERSDFRFVSLLLQLSVLGAMLLVAAGVFAQKAYMGGAQASGSAGAFLTPVFAGLSLAEILAYSGLVLLVGALIWQMRRR